MVENLQSKTMILRYNLVKDGKDKKTSQSFKNVKLDATSQDLFDVFKNFVPVLIGSGSVILKDELSELSES